MASGYVATATVGKLIRPVDTMAPEQDVRKVLYFEDDRIWADIVKDAVAADPTIELTVLTSASDFYMAIGDQYYDLVILDLNLDDKMVPRAHGLEIAAILSERRPDIPIMIISGTVTGGRLYRAAQLNVRDVVPKTGVRDSAWLLQRIRNNLV